MREVVRITGIEGIQAGGGGTVRIRKPTGPRYHQVKLSTTRNSTAAVASTIVDRLRLIANGKTLRDVDCARYLSILAFGGLSAATGELPLLFSDQMRADKADEQIFAFDTSGLSTCEIELALKTLSPGTDVPGVSGVFIQDFGGVINPKTNTRVLNVMAMREVGKNCVAGLNDFDTLPQNERIHRIHFFPSAGSITSFDVINNGRRIWEATKVENDRILRDYGLDGSQTGLSLAFDFTERADDFLIPQNLNVRLNLSAAASVVAVMETVWGG